MGSKTYRNKRKEQPTISMAATAQMEAVKPEEPVVPFVLQCSLCPKNPKFSDMSHLLTHISSKAHLHNKFSLEFEAKGDVPAKEKLEKYEHWYTENQIEAHLSARLAGKGQKKGGRRGRPATVNARVRQSLNALGNMRMGVTTPTIAASGTRTPGNLPPIGHWQTAPVGHSIAHHNGVRDGHYVGESAYDSPLARKQRLAYLYDTPAVGHEAKHRDYMGGMDSPHTPHTPSELDTSQTGAYLEDEVQTSRLKGVIWPGMDIFDAATVNQKRTRNQRKDGAAVDLLKSTSELITATETVWGPDGDFRKERDIYATPSIEGSPPPTPPRKRKNSTRGRNRSPTRTPLAHGEGADYSKRRRGGRASFAGSSAARHARVHDGKQQRSVAENSSAVAHAHRQKSFSVYYEDSVTSPGETQNTVIDNMTENGYDQSQHARSALQNLDPNLTIRNESPTYFKSSSSTGRYFEHGSGPHMSFQPQVAPYGSEFHGLTNGPLTTMAPQPRSGNLYPAYHNAMFSGPSGNEAMTSTFPPAGDRRMGFPGYAMDPSNSPFGYNDPRDMSLRESGFSDQSYRGGPGLFDV